ncbi:DUF975 family protein [Tindallia californiensis]|uniref:Integral membrane protein n=1 Tax=Tindallia californiensis TaxID=159292 RepID=A0A1H3IKU0_9FIRM|nr:DUF975 family protein [Tindallia californiensis]SDY28310.1 Protein of unknown function [Tindallia californiensis]
MWTRKEIKESAKRFLGKNYLKAFFVSLIIALVGGNENIFNNGNQGRTAVSEGGSFSGFSFDIGGININTSQAFISSIIDSIGIPGSLFFMMFFGVAMVVILWGFRVFVGIPIEVGGRSFFLHGVTDGRADIGQLASIFKSCYYLNIVKTMFLRGLYNFLWFLLLIIPGIIKHYQYKMVPYIMVEEPHLDSGEAIQKSIDMTKGQKMDLFVLDLSFIGWYLLGSIMFGIGVFFVHPYYEATYAQLYHQLKKSPAYQEFETV